MQNLAEAGKAAVPRLRDTRAGVAVGAGIDPFGAPSASAAIGRDALIGDPYAVGKLAALPEHVDRDSAAGEPVAADPEPARLQEGDEVLADAHRAILVKGAVVAETREIELQRLRLHDPFVRRVVDDEMGEIGLARHRAKGSEFRRGEARDVI